MTDVITVNSREVQALELHNKIMLNGTLAAQALASMCHDLKVMRDEKLYKEMGFEKFEEYCEQKVGIKSRQAYTYISSYEKLGQNVIAEYAHIGITKLELLCALDPVHRIDVLENEDLGDMSVSEVKELVARNTEQAEQLSLLEGELEDKKTREEDLEEQLLKLLKEKEELERTLASSKNEMLRLENELKTADTSTQKVKIYFTALQDTLNNLLTTVKEIENAEQKESLKSAVTQALTQVIETVRGV